MTIDIKDIEEFQTHFVTPLVQAVEKKLDDKLKPLVDQAQVNKDAISDLNVRTKKLEGNQAKALVGWTVLVTGITLLCTGAKSWLMAHFTK